MAHKIVLDLDKLLEEGKLTPEEAKRLSDLASKGTATLAFNLLIGFGVIAVAGGTLALFPEYGMSIGLGVLCGLLGWVLVRQPSRQWNVLANICLLLGGTLGGGGIILFYQGSILSFLGVAIILAFLAVAAKSALLTSLSLLSLSSAVGTRTAYFHATYCLGIQEPLLTLVIFGSLAWGLYQASHHLMADHRRLALVGARVSIFLVHFAFWIGSLWGERGKTVDVNIDNDVFSVAWALVLVGMGVWAWKQGNRWVLNTAAVFGAFHLYTQWFEYFGAAPGSIILAGLFALVIAFGLRRLNQRASLPAASA